MYWLDAELRAKSIFSLCVVLGLCGFLFLCVTWTACGECYIQPCCVEEPFDSLYKVNSSLCFAGTTTGMFFCFLSGWGALLTLKRRASIMGFGHFFGATCVTVLVAVQSAGVWGAESTMLKKIAKERVESVCEMADDDPLGRDVTLGANKGLKRSAQFLFTMSVIISIILIALAPLYFVSRDVYEDEANAGNELDDEFNTRGGTSSLASLARRTGVRISAYEPIRDTTVSSARDDSDESQYLGRAHIPMRPIRPQFKPSANDGAVDGI